MRPDFAVALSLILTTCLLHAEPVPDSHVEKRVEAVPIERNPPNYPRQELDAGREGWVVVSFVVQVDGSVRDVVVEDSSGLTAFERASLVAVQRWKYTPATADGAAVEQAVTRSKMTFALKPAPEGARGPFVRDFREAMKHLRAGENDAAGAIIARMEQRPRWNLYEDAWYWMLKFSYYHARGEQEPQLTSLRRAIAYEGEYLPAESYVLASRNLFALETAQAAYAEALAVHARLEQRKDAADTLVALAEPVSQMRALIAGPATLARAGRIGQADHAWVHRLARNEFALDEVSGEIALLEIRCEHQVRRLEWASDRAWTVPAAWGSCSVYVAGAADTTFRLLEYPATASATPAGT